MNQNMRKYLFLFTFLSSLGWHTAVAQTAAPQFAPVPPPAPGRSATPAKELSGSTLLAELKRGGYTIFFRHTATDFSRDDVKSRNRLQRKIQCADILDVFRIGQLRE